MARRGVTTMARIQAVLEEEISAHRGSLEGDIKNHALRRFAIRAGIKLNELRIADLAYGREYMQHVADGLLSTTEGQD